MIDLNSKPMKLKAYALAKQIDATTPDLVALIEAQIAMDNAIHAIWPKKQVQSYDAWTETKALSFFDLEDTLNLQINWSNGDVSYIICDVLPQGASGPVASEVQVDSVPASF